MFHVLRLMQVSHNYIIGLHTISQKLSSRSKPKKACKHISIRKTNKSISITKLAILAVDAIFDFEHGK